MNIVSWNVNGIRSVEKKGFLDWLKKESPDILCVQETKASPEQLKPVLRHPPGYYAEYSSAERKGYSGVATYSKNKPLETKHGFGTPKYDNEGRTLITRHKDFWLFNIYFPNGKQSKERLEYKMRFYDEFLKQADRLKEKGEKIIVCGDFNTAHKEIDLARPKENEEISGFLPIERKWMDKFVSHGYVDIFRKLHPEPKQYTWWSVRTRARERNVGWRIDYFFVTKNLEKQVKDAQIIPQVTGSDHCPISIKLK